MNSNQKNYTFGYGKAQVNMFTKRRTIDTYGKFIKPYLKNGMTVLDCGCGPGTLTSGIAEIVMPGKVSAIDINVEQIKIAKQNFCDTNSNIDFMQADVFSLPFDDNTFDLTFNHAILCHLKDPLKALKEQIRVLKPGGVVAAADGCCSAMIYPENPMLDEAFSLYLQPIKENGDIHLGLKHGQLFAEAGLTKIDHRIYAGNWNSQEISDYMINALETSSYNKTLLQTGKLSALKIKQYQTAWRNFPKQQGALFCFLWGHTVGYKKMI